MQEAKKLLGSVEISPEIIAELQKDVRGVSAFKEKIEKRLTGDITALLDVILSGSIILDASDIHIEPQETDARLRIRLDGILQDVV